MIVVSNTTPLLCLYYINHLNLLQELFGKIYVPEAVYNEITNYGENKPGNDLFHLSNFIITKKVINKMTVELLQVNLDYGESEAVVLAKELPADILLMDEKKARRVAQANNILIMGTLGVLLVAKKRGMVTNVKSLMDDLINKNIWIEKQLYHKIICEADEKETT